MSAKVRDAIRKRESTKRVPVKSVKKAKAA
jgi:hypothetical protein